MRSSLEQWRCDLCDGSWTPIWTGHIGASFALGQIRGRAPELWHWNEQLAITTGAAAEWTQRQPDPLFRGNLDLSPDRIVEMYTAPRCDRDLPDDQWGRRWPAWILAEDFDQQKAR
jgi:hypothetical protein